MKVVILAAGGNSIKLGWPIFSKPKTLYYKDGEIVIVRLIKQILKAGFKQVDIILVTGYKGYMFEQVLKENGFNNVNIRFNKNWNKSVVDSILTGIKGINEDIIIIAADLLVSSDTIKKFKNSDVDLACVIRNNTWGNYNDNVVKNNEGFDIVKIGEDKIEELLKLNYYGKFIKEKYSNIFRDTDEGGGIFLSMAFIGLFYKNKPYNAIKLDKKEYKDFDMYYETDEYKNNKFKIFTITWWGLNFKNLMKKIGKMN